MSHRLFLDTSYALALVTPADTHHAKARALAQTFLAEPSNFVTTRAVLLEIGDALAHTAARSQAVRLLAGMERDPLLQIVPLSDTLYQRATTLYESRPDKEWGLTDCVSFIVMQDFGLTDALTADRHFRQAGFVALLRDD